MEGNVFPVVGSVVKNYVLIQKLGESSCGQIYGAVARNSSKVTLKFFLPECYNSYSRESAAMSTFQGYSHIMRLIEHFTWQSFGVIVMERCTTDLSHFIEYEYTLKEAKQMFLAICKGVKSLHDADYIHRDLKPESIFLFADKILLGGLGSVIPCRDKVSTSGTFGTIFYTAPEILRCSLYDGKKADVWSLGIVLHVLLTGAWPYEYQKIDSLSKELYISGITVQIKKEKLPKDQALWKLLSEMLHTDPSKRVDINRVLSSSWFRPQETDSTNVGDLPQLTNPNNREEMSGMAKTNNNYHRAFQLI